jgi:hypothetical protein
VVPPLRYLSRAVHLLGALHDHQPTDKGKRSAEGDDEEVLRALLAEKLRTGLGKPALLDLRQRRARCWVGLR